MVTVVDEGGSNLARAFSTAADLAPAILCLEDLDSLVDAGSSRTQFLNLLDGLKPLEGVLVIGTTNHPESIDPAITKRPSRFDRVFVIPEPGLAQRVREALPLCVDVRVETRRDAEDLPQVELSSLTPTDLYTRYYQQAHGSAPTPETLAVFREVLEEATVQTS